MRSPWLHKQHYFLAEHLMGAKKNLYEWELEICLEWKNRIKLANVGTGLRYNYIFELYLIIGATLLLIFILNYGPNILIWGRIGNMFEIENGGKIPNIRVGLRSIHIFEFNSMIGGAFSSIYSFDKMLSIMINNE